MAKAFKPDTHRSPTMRFTGPRRRLHVQPDCAPEPRTAPCLTELKGSSHTDGYITLCLGQDSNLHFRPREAVGLPLLYRGEITSSHHVTPVRVDSRALGGTRNPRCARPLDSPYEPLRSCYESIIRSTDAESSCIARKVLLMSEHEHLPLSRSLLRRVAGHVRSSIQHAGHDRPDASVPIGHRIGVVPVASAVTRLHLRQGRRMADEGWPMSGVKAVGLYCVGWKSTYSSRIMMACCRVPSAETIACASPTGDCEHDPSAHRRLLRRSSR